LPAIAVYAIKLQMNYRKCRIAVQVPKDLPGFFHLDVQLLPEFPSERRFPILALFELAAGKFPLERELCRFTSLANQNTARPRDETGDDMNSFRLHIRPIGTS
jgi:hypothetical protein